MNDYSIGALESLSWARAVLSKCKTLEEFKATRKEIEEMIMRLTSGAAVDFKRRAEFIEVL